MAGDGYNVAIAGATGVVGGTVRRILEERDFPVGELRLLASARSAGRTLPYKGAEVEVQELGPGSFDGVDLVFFAAGGSVEHGVRAAGRGRRRHRHRQVQRVPHGPRRCRWWCPR